MFEGPEIQVQVKPHGNAKGSTPYFRTSDSTREQMLTVAAKHTPKLAIATMTKQQGGEMNVRSVSCLPRNREQISNIRRSTSSKDENVLYSVMLECKRVQGPQEAFVRDVKWPVFNKHIEQLVESQRDVIRALSGTGQYRLLPQFQYLGVPIQNWMKMRPDQRRKIISNFQEATLPSSKASTTQGQQKETQSIPNPSSRLSVSAEDSGIDVIPLVTLSASWVKADQLLSAENAITAAPGKDKKARMVLSYISVVPHLVQSRSGGQYICDDSCLHWKSAKICSHTLAVAEVNHELPEFLHWYSRAGITPNITAVGMQGLPRGSGRKGGRPKRQRKQQALPEPLLTVSPSQISPGTFNTCTDSSGPISQSVSIEVAAPIIPSASACNPTPVVGPPPLIPVSGPSTQPLVPNVNPFYCKLLGGNIRVCRGCRGNLRTADGGIPPPPYDMIIARAERCTFRNSSGELITPRRETVCHYHCKVECLRAAEPGFVCSSLHIPQDIYRKLNPVHIQHLQQSFNISPR